MLYLKRFIAVLISTVKDCKRVNEVSYHLPHHTTYLASPAFSRSSYEKYCLQQYYGTSNTSPNTKESEDFINIHANKSKSILIKATFDSYGKSFSNDTNPFDIISANKVKFFKWSLIAPKGQQISVVLIEFKSLSPTSASNNSHMRQEKKKQHQNDFCAFNYYGFVTEKKEISSLFYEKFNEKKLLVEGNISYLQKHPNIGLLCQNEPFVYESASNFLMILLRDNPSEETDRSSFLIRVESEI